jgi:enoyl-[acyl-carrier-protein] reductase (NADH)
MADTTILLIGSGNIGSALLSQLNARANTKVIVAGRSADCALDINDVESVTALDAKIPGGVDHVVVCCGASTFGPLANFDSASWAANCSSKLVAVTRLIVMLANCAELKVLKDGGSITVTAGQAARTINKLWPGIATNNAGLEAFVRNAGIDLPRGVRCNAVSPALVRETAAKAGLPLEKTVPAAECAAAYVHLIFSDATAQVVDAGAQVAFTKSHHAGQRDGVQPAGGASGPEPAAAAGGGVTQAGVDFRGQPSTYTRSAQGVVGLLAYDVCDGLTKEEYDAWLYDVHYHDLLANPHLLRIELRTVDPEKKAILSSGAPVTNELQFYRLAEMHFASHESYTEYIGWFSANVIPPPRTPAGKSAFKFYLLSQSEAICRG